MLICHITEPNERPDCLKYNKISVLSFASFSTCAIRQTSKTFFFIFSPQKDANMRLF